MTDPVAPTGPAADGLATAAAAGIHRIRVPTPFLVGRVNVYLVEDDPLTLVDAGPNSATSMVELERGLAERGHQVEELGRIVITHQHHDHIGLVQLLVDRSGAEVCALDRLAPWLANYAGSMEADDAFAETVMERHGIPRDVRLALRAVSGGFRAFGRGAQVDTPLADGAVLAFAERAWRVHHRPGHSPSDTVFHDEERDLLLGGDHLIGHISSNPLISRPLEGGDPDDRPRALVGYIASMKQTAAMAPGILLPGHGDPVTDVPSLVAERLRMHERRARKIAGMLSGTPHSAYEVATEMWGNIAVTQAYLTLSEVLGHVDLLLERGAVVEERDADGVSRFLAT
ncbi:MAG: MBL fold metallo-hydrolase [Solirubrobacterales bacterium]|nr:MBL fold metallo-hydrolase [Solirubrobacterales bacterium]